MGLLNDIRRFSAASTEKKQGSYAIPWVVYQLIEAATYKTGHFTQQSLMALEPFKTITVKLVKQSVRNMPNGWEVDPEGAAIIGKDKAFLSTVDKSRMEKNGLRVGITYQAFLMPPCQDLVTGRTLEDDYILHIILDKERRYV